MVTFLFQGDQLKGSTPRPTSLSRFQARVQTVPQTVCIPRTYLAFEFLGSGILWSLSYFKVTS